ncbi:MAG: metallophosphoesterase, partial [Candidatus Thorarchaeota archaeon]
MIIAVSDLHLGDSLSNEKGFINFIKEFLKPNQKEISHFVLLGDILDFWGKNITSVIQDHSQIFDTLTSLDFRTHYLVGNHDFALSDPRIVFRNDISVGKDISLTSSKTKLRFIHGHQLSYWYVLSFYEFFSHAMCFVTEEDETS